MTTILTDDERAELATWTAAHRPDRIRPLYRITPSYAGTVTVVNLRVRDEDDEPWGETPGYARPSLVRPRRHPLLRALWRAATMKYRRVV